MALSPHVLSPLDLAPPDVWHEILEYVLCSPSRWWVIAATNKELDTIAAQVVVRLCAGPTDARGRVIDKIHTRHGFTRSIAQAGPGAVWCCKRWAPSVARIVCGKHYEYVTRRHYVMHDGIPERHFADLIMVRPDLALCYLTPERISEAFTLMNNRRTDFGSDRVALFNRIIFSRRVSDPLVMITLAAKWCGSKDANALIDRHLIKCIKQARTLKWKWRCRSWLNPYFDKMLSWTVTIDAAGGFCDTEDCCHIKHTEPVVTLTKAFIVELEKEISSCYALTDRDTNQLYGIVSRLRRRLR